jgi:putative hemolysin
MTAFVFTHYFLYVALIFLMMVFLFFFTGMETALITSNRIYLEYQAKSGNKRAARAVVLLEDIEDAVSMTLIGTNIVSVAVSSFITFVATEAYLFDEPGLFIVTAVESLVLLIFCEITPKVIARAHAEVFLMFCSYPVKALLTVTKPAVKISLVLSRLLKKAFKVSDSSHSIVRSREEIDIMFKMGEEEGIIDEEHQVYVSEILSFNDITAEEIMTPTIDIVSVEMGQGIRGLAEIIVDTK